MEEHLRPDQGDRGSSEPLVRHVTQAHPIDLVDPWWMDQALSRDYREKRREMTWRDVVANRPETGPDPPSG